MTPRLFLKNTLKVSIAIVAVFAVNTLAQKSNAETEGTFASYLKSTGTEAGLIRKRVAPVENNAGAVTTAKAKELSDLEKRAFELINAKRAEFGISSIGWNDDVARIARLHSENMAAFGFFSHRGRDGKMVDDRADSLGISKWSAIGENIAYNRGFKDPIEIAVEKWLESQSHRENLLNRRWKESGIGIAVAGNGTYYLTQVFIVRK